METAALPLWISLTLDQVDATLVAADCDHLGNQRYVFGIGCAYTKPVYPAPGSAQIPHGTGSKITGMDALAIALGVAMFAILLGLIYAIDRV